ncbi:uncharacterized protein LOC122034541 isoform X1 [Zingiber officinale]|uniref:Uncharacterized protein n=1 Tax=Zingiber officinale TaxID=94328 RepID=A0A8J5ETX9_ZINOF|nr:uncharacterized protein LOC122034541 isoform X1 [Zingiber officinale]KAG6469227.1 hypothetical protein ZIOFF_073933 [Zingiber officinale]
MGNCQAVDTTAVVIQYPGGKVERLLWPTSAANVMKSNPGYHVALVTLHIQPDERQDGSGIRITRVKLLKPKEMLLLGQVYRLISSQEVARALSQRQHEKLSKSQTELIRKHQQQKQNGDEKQEHSQIRHEATRQVKDLLKNTQMTMKGRQWRPSLKSISEMPN